MQTILYASCAASNNAPVALSVRGNFGLFFNGYMSLKLPNHVLSGKRTPMYADGRVDISINEGHSREATLTTAAKHRREAADYPKRRWLQAYQWRGRRGAHGINANQAFGWRRLYLAGRLGEMKP
jgi:hypothetical protein